MAKWVLYENNRGFLTFLYRNLATGVVHNCGELRPDTPIQMVVQWILDRGAGEPGDIVETHNGQVFQLLPAEPLKV